MKFSWGRIAKGGAFRLIRQIDGEILAGRVDFYDELDSVGAILCKDSLKNGRLCLYLSRMGHEDGGRSCMRK